MSSATKKEMKIEEIFFLLSCGEQFFIEADNSLITITNIGKSIKSYFENICEYFKANYSIISVSIWFPIKLGGIPTFIDKEQ